MIIRFTISCASSRARDLRWLLRTIVVVAICATLLAFVVAPARAQSAQSAQSPEDLRKELDQLKADYEARIKALENRLAELEREQSTTKQSVATIQPPVEKAVRDTVDTVGQNSADAARAANQIGATPRYDQVRDLETKVGTLEQQA